MENAWKNMKLFLNINLVHLSNQILKGFEATKSTGMILIDLQEAFGTLDHKILLKKLKYIGFSPETVGWFQSYLKKQNFVISPDKNASQTQVF